MTSMQPQTIPVGAPSAISAGDRIPIINGLRALAIIGVVFHHYVWIGRSVQNPPLAIADLWLPLRVVVEGGWLGVDLFFFLSGFVLYLPYAAGSRRMDGLAAAVTFLKHRMQRLLPLYYFVAFVSLAFALLTPPVDLAEPGGWKQLLTLITVTFNFFPDTFRPLYNWVLWSLGIEVWFSVLFPLLVVVYQRWPVRTVVAAVLLAVATRYIGTVPFNGQVLNWIADSLPGRLPDFLAGMLAVDLTMRRPAWIEHPLTFFLGVNLCFAGAWGWHAWFMLDIPVKSAAFLPLILDAGFLLTTVFLLSARPLLSRLLEVWPMQLIGMMCYSFYVWHVLILYRVVLVMDYGDPGTRLERLPLYLLFLFVFSALSYRYIEFGHRPAVALFLPPRRTS